MGFPAVDGSGISRTNEPAVQDTPNAQSPTGPAASEPAAQNESMAFVGPSGIRGGSATITFSPATEQGHAQPSSAEQQAWADYNDKKAKWEAANTAFQGAKSTNAAVQARMDQLDTQMGHLAVLFGSQAMADGILTWQEIVSLAENGSDKEKAAAKWMMENKADFYDSMEKGWSKSDVSDRPNLNGEPLRRGITVGGFQAKQKEMEAYRRQAEGTKVPMPADPGPPPTPPGPATAGNAASGAAAVTSSALSGSVSPGLVGLGEGIDKIQAEINALVKDTKDNPANANANQAKISQLSNQLQALSALMNQVFTLQANISKMFSEMAMSAIRNMR